MGLEKRLDNVVFRSGFLPTIRSSRQAIRHGHIFVNSKKVDIPSFRVKVGDNVGVFLKSKMRERISLNMKDSKNLKMPSYLERIDSEVLSKVVTLPVRDDIPVDINEQLVVEYYSGI